MVLTTGPTLVSPDFVPFEAHSNATPDDVIAYSPKTRAAFQFAQAPHAYQLHFAQKLARLCRERGTRLVVLKVPAYGDKGVIAVSAPELSPDVLGGPLDIIGIPPDRFFSGIPAAHISKLFFNDTHFNENGQKLFTSLITPQLLRLYATSTLH